MNRTEYRKDPTRCYDCGGQPVVRQRRCQSCLAKQRKRDIKRRRKYVKEGRCYDCGRPAMGAYRCPVCKEPNVFNPFTERRG